MINNNCLNGFKLDEEYFNIRGEKVLINTIDNRVLKLYYDANNNQPTLLIKENGSAKYFKIGEIQKRRTIAYLESLTELITKEYIDTITNNDNINLDFDEADEILTDDLIII